MLSVFQINYVNCLINDRDTVNSIYWLVCPWTGFSIFMLCSKTMKWWETDIDLSGEASVTLIHLEYFSSFLWLSLQIKAPFLFVVWSLFFVHSLSPFCTFLQGKGEKKMCHLPFTCWGEYGSELESGGDSGSVLKKIDGGGLFNHKNSHVWLSNYRNK